MNPVDDFLKEAGFFGDMRTNFTNILPQAAAGTLMLAGAHGISRGFDAIVDRLTKTRDYKSMLKNNPSLSKYDAGHVQMVFNSLRQQAPSLSKDPLIAGSFIRNTLEVSPESGPAINPNTADLLIKAQNTITNTMSKRHSMADSFRPPMSFTNPVEEAENKRQQLALSQGQSERDVKRLGLSEAQDLRQGAQLGLAQQAATRQVSQDRRQAQEHQWRAEKHPTELELLERQL
jgi:hypothetical protein